MKSDRSFIVSAFYTKDTPYEGEARKLKKTCKKFNIPYDIVGIPQQQNWEANCAQKPRIIKEALLRHEDKNIVYLDADARIMRDPVLFDVFAGDVGVHYLFGKELLSGTIFLKNTNSVFNLVTLWELVQQEAEGTWDQIVLQDVLREFGSRLGIRLKTLPANYCQIEDIMAHAGRPVIKHTQASRRLKHVVGQ